MLPWLILILIRCVMLYVRTANGVHNWPQSPVQSCHGVLIARDAVKAAALLLKLRARRSLPDGRGIDAVRE